MQFQLALQIQKLILFHLLWHLLTRLQEQQEEINEAVFFFIILKYVSTLISSFFAFSICKSSPSLISFTAVEIIFLINQNHYFQYTIVIL